MYYISSVGMWELILYLLQDVGLSFELRKRAKSAREAEKKREEAHHLMAGGRKPYTQAIIIMP